MTLFVLFAILSVESNSMGKACCGVSGLGGGGGGGSCMYITRDPRTSNGSIQCA